MAFDDALDAEVVNLTALFTQYMRGGFQLPEVFAFAFRCVSTLAQMSLLYTMVPEAEKERDILAAIKRIYTRRSPDIPWIPEPFETMIESMIFDVMLPQAYRAFVLHLPPAVAPTPER